MAKKAIQKLKRGLDGRQKVTYVDATTGADIPFDKLKEYEVLTGGGNQYYDPKNPFKASTSATDEGDDEGAEEAPAKKKRSERSGPDLGIEEQMDALGSGKKNDSGGPNNNFGYMNKPKGMGLAGAIPGPVGLIGKGVNGIVNANNVGAVNKGRKGLGLPETGLKDTVKGIVKDNKGQVADVQIGEGTYSVGYKAMSPQGRTNMTVQEAQRRAAANKTTIKEIPTRGKVKSKSNSIVGKITGLEEGWLGNFIERVAGVPEAEEEYEAATGTPAPGKTANTPVAAEPDYASARTGLREATPAGMSPAVGRPGQQRTSFDTPVGFISDFGDKRPNMPAGDILSNIQRSVGNIMGPGYSVAGISGQETDKNQDGKIGSLEQFGSPRHGTGEALDFDVVDDLTGTRMTNPDALQDIIADFAYNNPTAGIGFGEGYMVDGRTHLDVSGLGGQWGAKNSSKNMSPALSETIDAARQGFIPTPFSNVPGPTQRPEYTPAPTPMGGYTPPGPPQATPMGGYTPPAPQRPTPMGGYTPAGPAPMGGYTPAGGGNLPTNAPVPEGRPQPMGGYTPNGIGPQPMGGYTPSGIGPQPMGGYTPSGPAPMGGYTPAGGGNLPTNAPTPTANPGSLPDQVAQTPTSRPMSAVGTSLDPMKSSSLMSKIGSPEDAYAKGLISKTVNTPAPSQNRFSSVDLATATPAQMASLGLTTRTPQERDRIARALAGELGPEQLKALQANDPTARMELANMVTSIENRMQSKMFDSNLDSVLAPDQYNSLMSSKLGVTNGNYALYDTSLRSAIDDFYAGNMDPSDYGISSYYTGKEPDWADEMQNRERIGDHNFGSLPEYAGDKAYEAMREGYSRAQISDTRGYEPTRNYSGGGYSYGGSDRDSPSESGSRFGGTGLGTPSYSSAKSGRDAPSESGSRFGGSGLGSPSTSSRTSSSYNSPSESGSRFGGSGLGTPSKSTSTTSSRTSTTSRTSSLSGTAGGSAAADANKNSFGGPR